MAKFSKTHYTVNDDVYGKIYKTASNTRIASTDADYAEVFEACEGLGNFLIPYLLL